MATLFLLILIVLGVGSGILIANKGDKAEAIKSILKDIFENIKDLYSNFKKLFILIRGMIQESSENNSSPLTNSDHQTNKPTNLSEEAPPADQPLKADISSSETLATKSSEDLDGAMTVEPFKADISSSETLATKSSEDLDGAMTVEPIEDLKEKESSLDEPMNINKDPKEEVSNTSHSSDGKEDNGDTVSIQ